MSALLAASQEAVRAQMRSAPSRLARSLPPPFHVATTVHDRSALASRPSTLLPTSLERWAGEHSAQALLAASAAWRSAQADLAFEHHSP